MSKVDVVRAWKDEEYRLSLTEEQRAELPEHPSGIINLEDEEMKAVMGAGHKPTVTFPRCCFTF